MDTLNKYQQYINMRHVMNKRHRRLVPCEIGEDLEDLGDFMDWIKLQDTEGNVMVTLTDFTKEEIKFMPIKYLPIFSNRLPRYLNPNKNGMYISSPSVMGVRHYMGQFELLSEAIITNASIKRDFCALTDELDFMADYFNDVIQLIDSCKLPVETCIEQLIFNYKNCRRIQWN